MRFSWLLLLELLSAAPLARPADAALPQQVYVWQRAWTPPVCDAVLAHATNFSEAAVLAAEVSWKNQVPKTARAGVDYSVLARTREPCGLVLRVGPFNGALGQKQAAVNYLVTLAAGLVAEARAGGIAPVELQIDFDGAESKLDDYRNWLAAIQQRVAPLPVTITVLPSWLDSPAFVRLAAAASNYVLQVHSLTRPVDLATPFTLCDPLVARRAVTRAGAIGVPFRVALPTYTYLVAFGANGKFIGLSAEPGRIWPEGTQLRELRADPLAMAALANGWATNRPAALRGLLWYRLPVAVDNLNWRWPTLGAIVAARVPRESFHAVARQVEAGLVEISLVNNGELDLSSRLALEARWSGARLIAGDGLHGFELAEPDGSAATFQNQSSNFRLAAGETQTVGWLRFDQNREVQLEIKKF
jgi:hypothetical protein